MFLDKLNEFNVSPLSLLNLLGATPINLLVEEQSIELHDLRKASAALGVLEDEKVTLYVNVLGSYFRLEQACSLSEDEVTNQNLTATLMVMLTELSARFYAGYPKGESKQEETADLALMSVGVNENSLAELQNHFDTLLLKPYSTRLPGEKVPCCNIYELEDAIDALRMSRDDFYVATHLYVATAQKTWAVPFDRLEGGDNTGIRAAASALYDANKFEIGYLRQERGNKS